MLYEPFELYSDVRKRNMIELIKGVIFELKADFNKEFVDLENDKNDQVYAIEEKNKAMQDLLESLQTTEELFVPDTHPLEKPELILEAKPEEVKVERYLTKEQRATLEEKRREQELFEAQLRGDTVG